MTWSVVLPPGTRLSGGVSTTTDDEVEAMEAALPSNTEVLVELRFPFRFPGFDLAADLADAAARGVVGLRPWPGMDRLVVAHPDEPAWAVAYLSSPAFWKLIIAAFAIGFLWELLEPFLGTMVRTLWHAVPEAVREPLEGFGQIVPLLVVFLVVTMLPRLLGSLRGQQALPP